jgi:O-antigen ligase
MKSAIMPVLQAVAGGLALSAYLAPAPHYEVLGFTSPTILGTFIAVVLLGSASRVVWVALFPALLVIGAATPFVVLLIGVLYLLPVELFGLLSFPGLVLVAWFHGDNGRLRIWKMTVDRFQELGNFWTGNGPGSFLAETWKLQYKLNPSLAGNVMPIWHHPHNDWLEIWFCGGALGLAACVALFALAVWVSRGRWRAMVVGYGVAMLFNPVVSSPLLFALGLVLFYGVVESICEGWTRAEAL